MVDILGVRYNHIYGLKESRMDKLFAIQDKYMYGRETGRPLKRRSNDFIGWVMMLPWLTLGVGVAYVRNKRSHKK